MKNKHLYAEDFFNAFTAKFGEVENIIQKMVEKRFK